MFRFRMCVLVLVAIAAARPLTGQESDPIFGRLTGEWTGEGTLMGRTAQFTMTWKHQRGFAVLEFANAFVNSDQQTTPVLNAVALYRSSPANPEAVWLDSRNQRVEIRWEALDSTLVSHWTAATEAGRTTYRVLSIDHVEVVDEVLSGDAWRIFGTAEYRRVREPS